MSIKQIQKLERDLDSIQGKLKHYREREGAIKAELAELKCRFRAGDIIASPRYFNGRRLYFLEIVSGGRWPRYRVKNIKKDGSLGAKVIVDDLWKFEKVD